MGSIRKAPRTGRWEARYRDADGRQRTITRDTKADARAALTAAEGAIRRGDWIDPLNERLTFGEWHDRWWPTIERSGRAANTIVQYETLLRLHVIPYLGHRRLSTLRRIDLEEWVGELRAKGLGASAIRTSRTLAGMVLRSAVDSGVIRTNPLAGVKLNKGNAGRAKQALTVEQLERLAEVAEPVGYRAIVLVMGYGGLRPNEAFALRRRHLDDFGQLVIAEGLVEVRGRMVETDGKTHTNRVVPLPASVLAVLTDHLHGVGDTPDAFMFTTPKGHPIGLRNFRRMMVRLAGEANLPDWFTPYSLRHTCASLMAQRGVPVTTAAALMGHDPAIYLRTYAHLYPGDLRSAAAALDAARTNSSSGGAEVVQLDASAKQRPS